MRKIAIRFVLLFTILVLTSSIVLGVGNVSVTGTYATKNATNGTETPANASVGNDTGVLTYTQVQTPTNTPEKVVKTETPVATEDKYPIGKPKSVPTPKSPGLGFGVTAIVAMSAIVVYRRNK